MIEMNELKRTESITLEIQITDESAQDIHGFLQGQVWETQAGYRYLLGAGLGYLRGESCLQDSTKDDNEDTKIKKLTSMISEAESHLAAIRYRMFELQQANQAWELSTGAVYTEGKALTNLVRRQKEEISELIKRIREQQAEVERLRLQTVTFTSLEPTIQEKKKSNPIWKRWIGWWRKT